MFTAGSMVKGGFYFNRAKWDLVVVGGRQGPLPGGEGQRYLRVPTWAMVLLAPVLGGLFVVFMPFIGFALLGHHLARRLVRALRRTGKAADVSQASRSAQQSVDRHHGHGQADTNRDGADEVAEGDEARGRRIH